MAHEKIFFASFLLGVCVLFNSGFTEIEAGLISLNNDYTPLYNYQDNVIILNGENFTKFVIDEHKDGKKLQFVQFYSSSCGHCQSFAPIFKSFLKTSLNWRDAIDISVIDGVPSASMPILQAYDISGYPTLKMFQYSPSPKSIGDEVERQGHDLDSVRGAVFKWIRSNLKTLHPPDDSPQFIALQANSKDELITKLDQKLAFFQSLDNKNEKPKALIVVEKDDSNFGIELMLDFFSQRKQVRIFRMVESDIRLLDQILPKSLDNFKLPFMMHYDSGKFELVLKPMVNTDKDYNFFTKTIKEKFLKDDTLYPLKNNLDNLSNKQPVKTVEYSNRIYQNDLNNALRKVLFHEVPLKRNMSIEKSNALVQFLLVIHENFPFENEKSKEFIKKTADWLKAKVSEANQNSGTVSSEELVSTMKNFEEYSSFPDISEWKACSNVPGTIKVRDFPCSMWTLFHILTVNEYRSREASKQWQQLHQTLYAMRDYIRNFFSCKECSKHFYSMAQNLESEIPFPNSSVIWLWKTHNRVNARLKDTEAENKKLPKRQFPTYEECPKCYKYKPEVIDHKDFDAYSSHYDEEKVFEFLLNFYDSSRIIRRETPVLLPRPSTAQKFKSEHQLKSFTPFSNLDYSMVILLYIVSIGLLVTLWGFISFRKNRRITSFLPL